MTSIKPIFKSIILSVFLFLTSLALAKTSFASPRLFLDPASISIPKNSDFDIKLTIDVENNSVFGAEAILIFPSSDIDIKNISSGGFFTDFSHAQITGRLEIHGFFSSPYDSKSGSGTFANLIFTAKKDLGSGVISFVCTGGENDTQILNTDGINILSCGVLNQSNLTYIAAGAGATASPTPTQDEPNSCGGTCGSNYNCKAEFFCYQGYCRNPACQTDTDCVCPTAKPAAKPKTASSSPTPQAVELLAYTPPNPSPTASATATPSPAAEEKRGIKIAGYVLWGLGLVAIIIVFWIIIRALKNRNNPPKITPLNPPYPPQSPEIPPSPPEMSQPENSVPSSPSTQNPLV